MVDFWLYDSDFVSRLSTSMNKRNFYRVHDQSPSYVGVTHHILPLNIKGFQLNCITKHITFPAVVALKERVHIQNQILHWMLLLPANYAKFVDILRSSSNH